MRRPRMGRKGQVVIPKEIRDQIGLKPGQEVAFSVEGNRVMLLPIPEDIVGFLRGWGKQYKGMLEALAEDHRWEMEKDDRRFGRPRKHDAD